MLTNLFALGHERHNGRAYAEQPRDDVQGKGEIKLEVGARVVVKVI